MPSIVTLPPVCADFAQFVACRLSNFAATLTYRCMTSLHFLGLALMMFAGVRAAAQPANLFDYDRSAPLAVETNPAPQDANASHRDISFAAGNERVDAFLVPAAKPTGPAILYVHWFGEPATTNRTQFLNEAVQLAERGVTSLLVNAMWSRKGWWSARRPETDLTQGVQQVIALRRAVDLLLQQPGVDPNKLAFVGHDFGAMYGAVMGAADQRPKWYVFLAPTPRMSDWYLFNVKPASPDLYRSDLAPLDPILAVGKLKAPVFYQFATKDKYVPAPRPTEFYDATAAPKTMATYEADHDLLVPEAARDRVAWLSKELGLK